MLRATDLPSRDQTTPNPTLSARHAGRPRVARLARALLFAAAVVVASACGAGGGDGLGGGGGGGGTVGAGTGKVADLGGANGATATLGGTRYTATESVGSSVYGAGGGFQFVAVKELPGGSDVEVAWGVFGELVTGRQTCDDDVVITLTLGDAGGGLTSYFAVDCALELDSFATEFIAGVGPITGRFAGTFRNVLLPTQQFAVTNGIFHFAAP